MVEVQAPGFSWTDSVWGRFELASALDCGTSSVRQRRQRNRHLRLAEQHLQRVPDDPLALAALARARDEMGFPDASADLIPIASQLAARSHQWRPGQGWDKTITVTDLLKGHWWLWPVATDAIDQLTQATGEHEGECWSSADERS
jgi:hypothetical protein